MNKLFRILPLAAALGLAACGGADKGAAAKGASEAAPATAQDGSACGTLAADEICVKIGSGAQIAAQSGIMRDIEPGTVVMGSPAVPFKDFMRQVAFLQKNSKK